MLFIYRYSLKSIQYEYTALYIHIEVQDVCLIVGVSSIKKKAIVTEDMYVHCTYEIMFETITHHINWRESRCSFYLKYRTMLKHSAVAYSQTSCHVII